MKGYFLGLAQLALSCGNRIEPRSMPEWEGGWIEEEGMPESSLLPVRRSEESEPVSSNPSVAVALSEVRSESQLRFENSTTNEYHSLEISEIQSHSTSETKAETREIVQLRKQAVRESKETLRELVREARIIRERTERQTFGGSLEAAPMSEASASSIERRTEVERLVREIEKTQATKTTVENNELRIETDSPSIEIHIGRIDVRVPAPTITEPVAKDSAKPRGVIELDEYLKERSRGNL